MTLQDEIITWVDKRPTWQQAIMARVVRGQTIDETFIETIVDSLVSTSTLASFSPLIADDLPISNAESETVSLTSIQNLKNVNALQQDQVLNFGADGITIIYGDNGSGKSGYARLIKSAVGARHLENVLPDAFSATAGKDQSAEISYSVGPDSKTEKWPIDDNADLRSVHFYDEACGDHYISSDSEVKYRPSVLTIFDDLVVATDRVRQSIDARLTANASKSMAMPTLDAASDSTTFVQSLTRKTLDNEIDAACAVTPSVEEDLAALIQEEARLRATDPARERARLASAATAIDELADGLDEIDRLLSHTAAQALIEKQVKMQALREAARAASNHDFHGEPLGNVGSVGWRAMWTAAEKFILEDSSHNFDFPIQGDDARCPLCQQTLTEDGRGRLNRFHAFVHNDTERAAKQSEEEFSLRLQEIETLKTSDPTWSTAVTFIESNKPELANKLAIALTAAEAAKTTLLARLRAESEADLKETEKIDTEELRELGTNARDSSAVIDSTQFQEQLLLATKEKAALADRLALSKLRVEMVLERDRLKSRHALEQARSGTSTNSISTKVAELTKKYVTTAVTDQFTRESDKLTLDKITLGDRGANKGVVRQKPALIGGSGGHLPNVVLSEGEQTALGLAGLFTEIHFDESQSAVVFDDPISSLDHQRRKIVATRIAELATNRQVVVFTHDLSFVAYLAQASALKGVKVTDRCISRNGARKPGFIIDNHPWKAKDAAKRINELRETLATIKRDRATWDEDEYLTKTATWAGRVSETWERMIRVEVVNQVVDGAEVKPRMFRILSKITVEDNTDFQDGYGVVSEWATRHDKSDETNFVAPTPEEMQVEFDRLDSWFKRIKSYRN